MLILLVLAVSKARRRRFVDDAQNLKPRDRSCVLRGLTLCIREVCRHCDYCLSYGLAEIVLCVSLELLQNHCADFLRSVLLAVDVHAVIRAHLALD